MHLGERDYFTVSEINREIKAILGRHYPQVRIVGEISNFKRHSSGHLYFTLKDAESQLRATCFRRDARNLEFEPEDGVKVLVSGRITVYEPYGQYQIVASRIEKTGAGELELAFRALKEKLQAEGLFDPAHKQPLPDYPFKIAVVTSPTGAAVRDIISTVRRRWPCARLLVAPVRVQGERAAGEIAHALSRLPGVAGLDVVILGRGGGSLEDLWAFNEEEVARAVYACPVPIVSAVGHETDFTIADFVADVRAATPTMAAEIAVPELDDVLGELERMRGVLVQNVRAAIEHYRLRLRELLRSYALGQVRGKLERYLQAHDYAMEKLQRRMTDVVRAAGARWSETMTRLRGLDARAILDRGYAVCADLKTGAVIGTAAQALESVDLRLTFRDGSVHSEVKEKLDGKHQT
ncbi:MAG: exodeoxyribonuclease VII large subunit [Candidatus Krumholzibacteriia bacterium]